MKNESFFGDNSEIKSLENKKNIIKNLVKSLDGGGYFIVP